MIIPLPHSRPGACASAATLLVALVVFLLLSGCRSCPGPSAVGGHPFEFGADTFAFANELQWEYSVDPKTGSTTTRRRIPPPEYTHRCFVLARSARQFFFHALFEPEVPELQPSEYQTLVQEVMQRSPRCPSPPSERVVIPGFADLHQFSRSYEATLKAECGGSWQSYSQRGNWRVVFPFTRRHQAGTAEELVQRLSAGVPVIVHLVRFPRLTINHALLLFAAERSEDAIAFRAYDPNNPDYPVTLHFHRESRTFVLDPNNYFAGGRVDVYEIYRGWWY